MGLFDKLKETLQGGDDKKSFQATFTEQKMGMTISAGKKQEALVTGGESPRQTTAAPFSCCGCPTLLSRLLRFWNSGPDADLLRVSRRISRLSPQALNDRQPTRAT